MKQLLLATILIALTFISAAQIIPPRVETSQEESDVISTVQDLLAEGKIVEAATLLNSVTNMLNTCVGTVAVASSAINTSPAPSNVASDAVKQNERLARP